MQSQHPSAHSAAPRPALQAAHLWEFALVFGVWYIANRLTMILLHVRTEGGWQELWRGSQVGGGGGGGGMLT